MFPRGKRIYTKFYIYVYGIRNAKRDGKQLKRFDESQCRGVDDHFDCQPPTLIEFVVRAK